MIELPTVDGWFVRYAHFTSHELTQDFGIGPKRAERWLALHNSTIWDGANALEVAEFRIWAEVMDIGGQIGSDAPLARTAARAVLLLAMLNHESACEIISKPDRVMKARGRLDTDPDFVAALHGNPKQGRYYVQSSFQSADLLTSVDRYLEEDCHSAIRVLNLEVIADRLVTCSPRALMTLTTKLSRCFNSSLENPAGGASEGHSILKFSRPDSADYNDL